MECHLSVAPHLVLCPASYESGEKNDRKGRITRQEPARLRNVLCQAAWVSVIRCGISQRKSETALDANSLIAAKSRHPHHGGGSSMGPGGVWPREEDSR